VVSKSWAAQRPRSTAEFIGIRWVTSGFAALGGWCDHEPAS
jgi:hypothetical protein